MTAADRYTDFPPGNLEKLLEQAVAQRRSRRTSTRSATRATASSSTSTRSSSPSTTDGADHRWRVIHAQVVHPADFARFGRLKLVAEVNPYHVSDDMRWMEERIGHDRSRGAYAFRTLKDAGAVLVFGSDSPGTNAARYFLIRSMASTRRSRQTLEGRAEGWVVSRPAADDRRSDRGLYQSAGVGLIRRGEKGTIAVGRLADLAVFDTEPRSRSDGRNPPDCSKRKRAVHDCGGRVVYEAARATEPSRR